jgi:UDPglucose 6-dehydrogenase
MKITLIGSGYVRLVTGACLAELGNSVFCLDVGADAVVIVTEWNVFRSPDFAAIKAALKQAVIFDGRNLFEPAPMKQAGIEYLAIGRSAPA